MRTAPVIIIPVAVGLGASLLTGLLDVTPSGLLGATWYGWPLVWLRKLVLAPQYNPWKVDWGSLVGDVAFWSLVAGVVLSVAVGLRSKVARAQGRLA